MTLKRLLNFIAFLILPIATCVAQSTYSNSINIDINTYKLVKPAVDDLKQQLSVSAGSDFTISTNGNSASGINIIKLNTAGENDKRIDKNNDDAVLIQSDGKSFLSISAYTKQGLINGIYTYLDTLGFRWYAPGANWNYIPKLKSVALKLDKVFVPDFALRTFFGTFGTPRNPVIDKSKTVDAAWHQWAMRNRLGGGYQLKGHSWNDFMWANRDVFTAHPDYMALVNGKRVGVKTASKFCISNEGFQQVFIKAMTINLEKMMKAAPDASVYCVSVEPSDGGGDCQCDQCKKMGTVSDRVFFLANLVAKELKKVSPKAYVNLYAYNTHAEPPHFAIEPNVIVQIIPYGYQHYASAEDMIDEWSKKTHNLFIYDYYGLPIKNLDRSLRGMQRPEGLDQKIKHWHQLGIKGITLESSYSIGATGLGLYLFTRLGWNAGENADAIKKEYFDFCYGKASEVVAQIEQRLGSDGATDAALAATMPLLLQKTANIKLDDAAHTRLVDYKAYLHYLKLLNDFQHADKQNLNAQSDALMEFVYGTFYRMMEHPLPLSDYLKTTGPNRAYIKTAWDYAKPGTPGMKFATVTQLTDAQIEDAFANDCKNVK